VGTLEPQILFITGNRLGDAVLSTGILDHVMRLRPGARVTIACGGLPAPLFADLPGLDRIIPIVKGRRRRFGHWLRLWREVAGQRWSDVIDVRSAFFAWSVRARHRWVCRAEKRNEHRIEELARQLGIVPPPDPRLYVSLERAARMAALIKDDRPILALGPAANWGGKVWPAERFAEAALRLTAPSGILPDARLMVLGAPHERSDVQPVLAATKDPLDLTGGVDLLDVFALLQRASLYIGNDSGLMHMAAAAGIPTLGLFGPSAEWRYRPWGEATAVVRTPESLEQLTAAADYDYRSHKSLMLNLTTDMVVEAAEQLWRRVHLV
jgi:ADP-heptose:LPS heptosyltransferase